jgi:hypothetical protein
MLGSYSKATCFIPSGDGFYEREKLRKDEQKNGYLTFIERQNNVRKFPQLHIILLSLVHVHDTHASISSFIMQT